MGLRARVRVPASSANLGPGFDVLAAAVSLHAELEVERTGRFAVHTDLRIARDRRNLSVRAFAALHPPDEFEFTIRSDIPLAGGLGTSAAAFVAGLVAADAVVRADAGPPAPLDRAALLQHATRLEGHPDNVAAALLGGFVVCDGIGAQRFDAPPGLEAILVVPGDAVRTAKARAALPAEVPMGDAVFNVAHVAALVLGLARGDLELVARGLGDRLHQPRRAHLYPRSMEIVAVARELGALGATISGAGPTVLVWCEAGATAAVREALHARCDGWADVVDAPFEPRGASVEVLSA